MDKRKKEQFKQIEKALIKELKTASKTFNYKAISNSLYKEDNNFFVHCVYFATYIDNALKLTVWNYVKTYESDNLFWTIFDMKDNIGEKDSLRANGAYTMPSFKIGEYSLKIEDTTDLNEASKNFIKKIAMKNDDFIDSLSRNTKKFDCYLLEQSGYLREELIKMIANIELKNLRDAKEMAEGEIVKGNRGGFRNNDKDIYEYILEYCKINS
ncbi:MAG: hypothetical protein RR646_06280 [Erysipelotrichaceae bacterium]